MKLLLSLILLGAAVIFTLIALFWIFCLRERSKNYVDFEVLYGELKDRVDRDEDNDVNCRIIKSMFAELADLPYTNREKCNVLEAEFYSHFKNAKYEIESYKE